MKTSGKFVEFEGRLVWEEKTIHEIVDTGKVYLCMKEDGPRHQVYKLCKVPKEDTFFWSSLWNTAENDSFLSVERRRIATYSSIKLAIQTKLKQNWLVKQAAFEDMFPSQDNHPFNI